MKTLAHERAAPEIARRLTTIRPDARALWGKMSAHQMVCHLSDSFRMALGRKTAKDVGGVLQRTVVKWIALYGPVRWPTELVTVPEVGSAGRGNGASQNSRRISQTFPCCSSCSRIGREMTETSGRLTPSSAECRAPRGCGGDISTRIITSDSSAYKCKRPGVSRVSPL